MNLFQSTHPRRVWLIERQITKKDAMGFNPHTHAGCDRACSGTFGEREVSIHTPTQGVTVSKGRSCSDCRVSIHTPTQGVTPILELWKLLYRCFNPHTHAGCDIGRSLKKLVFLLFQSTHPRRVWRRVIIVVGQPYNVSIHTPTQGVTHF